jgi:hypothetical protein
MNRRLGLLGAVFATAWLASCGGGDGGSTAPTTQASSITAEGTMSKTSANTISVNGVEFDVSAARVTVGDETVRADALRSGMLVSVSGSAEGARGRAVSVDVRAELVGPVTEINPTAAPPFFVAGGVKVVVDNSTVFEDLPGGLNALRVGMIVEVHGLRDAGGVLIATRVEVKAGLDPADLRVHKVRGPITAVGSTAFEIGGVTVTYGAATLFVPPPFCSRADLQVGRVVDVRGRFTDANTLAAFMIRCVDFAPAARNELEGFVADLDTGARTFRLNGVLIRYDERTEFRNGSVEDLIDNAKVEIRAVVGADGVLLAVEIEFKRVRVILATAPSAVGTDTLTMFGKTVVVNDLTRIRTRDADGRNSTSLADIVAGSDRVQVHAFVDDAGTIVAILVVEIGDSHGGRDIVQARVAAENEAARTLGLLDAAAPINVAFAPDAEFENDDGAPLTAAQFFAAVVPASPTNAGTLVKVKGRFSGGVLLAEEGELED